MKQMAFAAANDSLPYGMQALQRICLPKTFAVLYSAPLTALTRSPPYEFSIQFTFSVRGRLFLESIIGIPTFGSRRITDSQLVWRT